MADYKAALANAGAFAIAVASFVVGTFVLPNDFGNLQRLVTIVVAIGVYVAGHVAGQRFASVSSSIDRKDLEHKLEKANESLTRLADADAKVDRLQKLLDAEKTLSSSYREKAARAEERLRRYEEREAEEEARERGREDHKCVAFRENVPFTVKELLAGLMYVGARDVPGTDAASLRQFFDAEARAHVIVEEVGSNTVRVSLRDSSREFFERHPELLEDARKALSKE